MSLKKLVIFYRALGQMLQAGVPILRTLDTVSETMRSPALAGALAGIKQSIERGSTLGEAMTDARVFPPMHTRLICVAERSGRVDLILIELASSTEQLVTMRQTLIAGSVFPLIVLHLGIFIPPTVTYAAQSLLGQNPSLLIFLFSVTIPLVVVWGGVIVGVVLARTAVRSKEGAAFVDSIIGPLPLLGKTWREFDYWRVATGVQMLTNAGMGIIEALRDCAEFCRSPRIANALRDTADEVEREGGRVSDSFRATGVFPAEMISMWATGEESGKLDDMLGRIATYYAERCNARMQELARWLPRIAYALVSIYIIIQIFAMFSGYIKTITELSQ